jgi:hypothetical protein
MWRTMDEQETLQRTLARARRTLQLLEEQAAGFGQLHLPAHLQLEIEEKREEIAGFEARLADSNGQAHARVMLASPDACPYPGLASFTFDDSHFFYGRDAEIRSLLQRLRHQRYLFVIGPSGSGKSSLVFAGLLPELQGSKLFAQDYWLVRDMRPGAEPLQALADLLGGDIRQAGQALADLLAAHGPAQRLLLVIDQFEELFTLADRGAQAQFIAAMIALRAQDQCTLVVTMRADFYPQLMSSDLWPVEPFERLEIAPLRGKALRQAIQRPAMDVGVVLEPALVECLMDDADNQPGVLPLIQETMRQLWHDMEDGVLTLQAYEALGNEDSSGLAVAVARMADGALGSLTPAQRKIARRIFVCLVQINEHGPDTRRQERLERLRSANDDSADFERTVERLTHGRLLIQSGGDDGQSALVDLAHDTLIHDWPQLRKWLDQDRADLVLRQRLVSDAREWARHLNDPSFLYGGTRLADAQAYVDLHGDDVGAQELAFLDASAIREQGRERARYLGQAGGGAVGTALGYGIALALILATTGAEAEVVLLLFAAMFPAGALVGAGIGVALWQCRHATRLRAPAALLAGAAAGGIAYPFSVMIASISPIELKHVLAGAALGAAIGLGVGWGRTSMERLAGAVAGGAVGMGLALGLGGLAGNVIVTIVAGLALGGLAGLGFLATAADSSDQEIG